MQTFFFITLLLLSCHRAPTGDMQGSPEAAEPVPAPNTTKKINGTVISFGRHPNLSYQYIVLSYLDDDGMLRDEILVGQSMTADLSPNNRFAQRVHLDWIPREGDRFRMTRDGYGNYDITKIVEQ